MPDTPPPASPMFSLNEVRSPQERRPGPELGHHRVRCASTKSAPHRSGDACASSGGCGLTGLNEVRSPQERRPGRVADDHGGVPASTKSAPHRSGDRVGHHERHRGLHASTKSAPHRSGDTRDLATVTSPGSPQRSPLPTGAETDGLDVSSQVIGKPQRSPLPTGAETASPSGTSGTRSGLNEVRSPQERRLDAMPRATSLP